MNSLIPTTFKSKPFFRIGIKKDSYDKKVWILFITLLEPLIRRMSLDLYY